MVENKLQIIVIMFYLVLGTKSEVWGYFFNLKRLLSEFNVPNLIHDLYICISKIESPEV